MGSVIADNFNINIDDIIHIANRHPESIFINLELEWVAIAFQLILILIEKQNYKTSIIKTSRELN